MLRPPDGAGVVTVGDKIQAYFREALARKWQLSDFQLYAAGKDAVVIINLKDKTRQLIAADPGGEEEDYGTLC